MAERELVEFIRSLCADAQPSWLRVGVGDDAAVLDVPGDASIVVTTDMLIEGTHFAPDATPEQVGYKAIACCLSDLAAMAARPLCTVAGAAFGPGWDGEATRRLTRALWGTCRELSAPLVGGDVSTTSGPLTINVTALGTVGAGGAALRSGARAGDAVCVTGRLGGAMRGRHLAFTPRIAEALELADRCDVHAMIDVSDGLSTDALHIAAESGVGVALELAAIPLSDDAAGSVASALSDGEDYELLFCVSAEDARLLADTGLAGTQVSIIGAVTPERESVVIGPDGARRPLRSEGWEHQTG